MKQEKREEKICYAWGNGQLANAMTPSKEYSKTLDCMQDPAKVLIIRKCKDK